MKRIIAILLTAALLCGLMAAQASAPDSYLATGGAIPDKQTYSGSAQQTYQKILTNHTARIHAYQSRSLEAWARSVYYIPCKPVSLVDLTDDGIPELIFIEVVNDERGDLYIYSSNGSTTKCVLYVPGITRLDYDDYYLGFDIYMSSNAGGTLVIEYYEYEQPWLLQFMRNGLNQYYMVTNMTMEYDPSGDTDDDRYYRNGSLISMHEYDDAIYLIESSRTLTISEYLAEDESHYGLDMTWEEAVALMAGSAPVTSAPKNTSEDIYGLAIDKLATRTGPGTQYEGGGTYSVKGQYIQILARAYDKRNGIWWVKCVIPYKGEKRILWTGYKRFDPDQLPLESIPIEEGW